MSAGSYGSRSTVRMIDTVVGGALNPLVSIVIPTYNSESTIGKCLKSVKSQTYNNIEMIVVDKGSLDKTVFIVANFGALPFVIQAKERSEQINYGVKKATGKYVYIIGSDFILESSVVEEAVKKCEQDRYDAICVHNTSDPSVSFWAKVRKLERDCYIDDEFSVAARFFKKEVFETLDGFDEDLIAAEDYDLHNRLLFMGYRIGRIRSWETHIGEPKTLEAIAKKYYYYGKTLPKFLHKSKGRGLRQLSPVKSAFIRHRVDFLGSPLLTIGFIIYQIVRYSSASLGFIARKLRLV